MSICVNKDRWKDGCIKTLIELISSLSWFRLWFGLSGRLEVRDVLFCQPKVVRHALFHLIKQFLILCEACHKELLLTLQLGSVEYHLRAHLMQFALLLHSLDQLGHVLDRQLDAKAGRMKFFNQFLGVAELGPTLIRCVAAVFTRKVVHLVEKPVETLLIVGDLLGVEQFE